MSFLGTNNRKILHGSENAANDFDDNEDSLEQSYNDQSDDGLEQDDEFNPEHDTGKCSASSRQDILNCSERIDNNESNSRTTQCGVSQMRKRWKQSLPLNPEDIKNLTCCKRLKCFQNANAGFLISKMKSISDLSFSDRRLSVADMIGSDGHFLFDGRRVCGRFLTISFHFSGDLLSSVKKESMNQNFVGTKSEKGLDRLCNSRDSIISFLERLAEDTADLMPDTNEQHLPYFRKIEVYDEFVAEYKLLYGANHVPVYGYFITVWREYCHLIKVRKFRRFAKCTICEEIRVAIKEARAKRQDTTHLKSRKRAHIQAVMKERLEYRKKREKAMLHPRRYISFIIDGADQSAFGIPHFCTNVKSTTGNAMKVRLIGALEHGQPNKLLLMTLTEEYETGANHIIQALHVCLNKHEGKLPEVLYLQLDNCTKENKNRFFFSFLEFLVQNGTFKQIFVGFLPVGHTHEDIDQAFSRTADRLRSNDAVTLLDMKSQLQTVYNSRTFVTEMDSVINWSGLCTQERCLTNVSGFSHYRHFRFALQDSQVGSSENGDESNYNVRCWVKVHCTENWRPLTETDPSKSFMKWIPDITLTPSIVTKVPPDVEKVTTRIRSEESRINCVRKTSQLYSMRDRVFTQRSEPFDWDLSRCVETRHMYGNEDEQAQARNSAPSNNLITADNVESHQNNLDYEVNSYLVVNSGENQSVDTNSTLQFWVGIVNSLEHDISGRVSHIEVHWCEPTKSSSLLDASYKRAFIRKSGASPTPWKDRIVSESVLLTFPTLTNAHKLPSAVKKLILNEPLCHRQEPNDVNEPTH